MNPGDFCNFVVDLGTLSINLLVFAVILQKFIGNVIHKSSRKKIINNNNNTTHSGIIISFVLIIIIILINIDQTKISNT